MKTNFENFPVTLCFNVNTTRLFVRTVYYLKLHFERKVHKQSFTKVRWYFISAPAFVRKFFSYIEMPMFIINTNVPNDKIPPKFTTTTAELIAEILEKPVEVKIVTLLSLAEHKMCPCRKLSQSSMLTSAWRSAVQQPIVQRVFCIPKEK